MADDEIITLNDIETSSKMLQDLVTAVSGVIKGKQDFLELLVTAVAAGGHVLLEDLPGLGKTTAARTLAALIDTEKDDVHGFSRIQFTPDLLPYDITGVDVYHP
jgi:MoxR-like ATPase